MPVALQERSSPVTKPEAQAAYAKLSSRVGEVGIQFDQEEFHWLTTALSVKVRQVDALSKTNDKARGALPDVTIVSCDEGPASLKHRG